MNTKLITKIIVALMIVGAICFSVQLLVGAPVFGGDTFSKVLTQEDPSGYNTSGGFQNSVARILGVVKYICYAAAVVMLVMLGVKYLTASPDGKAEIKKTAVQYVIGAVLVFAAGVILTIIQSVSNTTIQATE